MNVKDAYNSWSNQYDANENKTRDLEAVALRKTLDNISFKTCLEVGCGTGKNTAWLITKSEMVTAIDLSENMLEKAKSKIVSEKVEFKQVDINREWNFTSGTYDLITFSLVLEHIEDVALVLQKSAAVTKPGGYVYIGELHPFKQYNGAKARFETEAGLQVVPCFTHHISDFVQAGLKFGFDVNELEEYFDNDDRNTTPRILTILFRKR
jgi:2-polyprenyl-3-methyl-5-hydroxy-6-metoxy-1,4-benzoquinol methylase